MTTCERDDILVSQVARPLFEADGALIPWKLDARSHLPPVNDSWEHQWLGLGLGLGLGLNLYHYIRYPLLQVWFPLHILNRNGALLASCCSKFALFPLYAQ